MALRPKPEKKEQKERVRLALLQAAVRLSAAHGFGSLSLREVSREADIAPTSFYRHFTDMEELGLAMIDELAGPMFRAVAAQLALAVGPDHEPSLASGQALFAALREDSDLFRFVIAERAGGSERFRAAILLETERFIDDLAGILRSSCRLTDPSLLRNAAEAVVATALEASFRSLDVQPLARAELLARTVEQVRMITLGAEVLGTRRAESVRPPALNIDKVTG
jgi:AcrR family transcriptional regulator